MVGVRDALYDNKVYLQTILLQKDLPKHSFSVFIVKKITYHSYDCIFSSRFRSR